ncbi:LCP family protein [Paenibacillus melissococcoides]|uniref:LCP family protein n=1 Tax=Paenibacillus melissococcoides TaxID=2912268 RepID=A0ABM9G3M2_9BACL|nr:MULTISPECIES: LCP family protein [Paenibacillus]MEB9894887.1 LCP family protein [Bacillus cereus]CAH8246189.1 LCP family protein [Paenibacillus melissococcoides]CAH8713228.1 LCP family protein [Paenibacillus melissococcoides]CAH8713963.1 LCP family protein [Paenibacillus melissococcoides]GIO80776.1 transcriptional regulator LytR [Paenibacillus dendritiformis]
MKLNKKWAIIALAAGIVLVGAFLFRKQLAVLAFDMFLSDKVEQSLDRTYKPIYETKDTIGIEDNPFSLLLLGIDQRDKEIGRSDSILYTVVRPKDNRILLLSIPRDSYAEIVGKDKQDKIAHAYAFGGAKMSVESVEHLLQHPVNHYAAINFKGFRDVVDALGGVELPITEDIRNQSPYHDKFLIEANKPIYTGLEALNYVRYREDSDMNRMERNRIFLQALIKRMVQLDKISHLPELLEIAGDNLDTDILPGDMIGLAKMMLLKDSLPSFTSYSLVEEGKIMDDIWYGILDEENLDYARKLIGNWLDPEVPSEELLSPEVKG